MHAIQVDASTLLGEFLANSPKATGAKGTGGRPSKSGAQKEPLIVQPLTYKEIGITKKEASMCQRLLKPVMRKFAHHAGTPWQEREL